MKKLTQRHAPRATQAQPKIRLGLVHSFIHSRDALADLFPIHRDWLAHLAVLVLHAAWHGIGAWHRDTFPTIQFPEANDLVMEFNV